MVIDKSVAVGMGGQLANNVDVALAKSAARGRACTRWWRALADVLLPASHCAVCSGKPRPSPGRERISSI